MPNLKFVDRFEKVAMRTLSAIRLLSGGISSRTGRPFKQVHKKMLGKFLEFKPDHLSRAQAVAELKKHKTHKNFDNNKETFELLKSRYPKKLG